FGFSASTQALKEATSSSLVMTGSGISTPIPLMMVRFMSGSVRSPRRATTVYAKSAQAATVSAILPGTHPRVGFRIVPAGAVVAAAHMLAGQRIGAPAEIDEAVGEARLIHLQRDRRIAGGRDAEAAGTVQPLEIALVIAVVRGEAARPLRLRGR